MEETHKNMLEKVEKWGDSVEAAVKLALNDLKLTRDEVDVEVLEQPTRGFFGFHKKLAKVRVTRKQPEPEAVPPEEPEIAVEEPVKEPVRVPDAESVPEMEAEPEIADTETVMEAETEQITDSKSMFGENTYVIPDSYNNAGEEESDEEPLEEEEEEEIEVLKPVRRRRDDRRRGGASLMHTKFSVTDEDKDAVPADDSFAVAFLKESIARMGLLSVNVSGSYLDDTLYISLTGNEVGALIGKRGKTLDSLQYLASIVENKNAEKYTRVLVNAENYREKREKTLQQFARKVADKCARSGRSQRLEPMNPYERKVIHSTLQSDPRVATRSEGSEPSRRVVIEVRR